MLYSIGENHNLTLGNILGADGKLTEDEKEQCQSKNLCMYCGHPLHDHDPACQFKTQPPAASGQATFTLMGSPPVAATIEEFSEVVPTRLGN